MEPTSVERDGIRPPAVLGAVAVAAACLVGLLRWAIGRHGWVTDTDARALRWVLGHRGPVATDVLRAFTALGDIRAVIAVGVVGVVVLTARRRGDLAVVLVVSSAGAWLIVNSMKWAVSRPRPPEVTRLVAASGWSFPSGHAGQAAAMYLALGVTACIVARGPWSRRLALSASVLTALLIGLSRVYLGVHWLSDVVAGWSVGVAWFAAVLALAELRRRRRPMPPSEFTVASPSANPER